MAALVSVPVADARSSGHFGEAPIELVGRVWGAVLSGRRRGCCRARLRRLPCASATDPARSEERAEELAAYIKDRPGKIFKLLSALHFLGVALACTARRSKPVRDFWEKPPAGTFGDMILAWCYMTSPLCLLVLSPGSPSSWPTQAGWHLSSSSAGRAAHQDQRCGERAQLRRTLVRARFRLHDAQRPGVLMQEIRVKRWVEESA